MRNNQTLEQVSNVAESKVQLLKNSKGKYFLSSFMAGMFIGLGILLTFTVGGVSSGLPTNKILMGVSFGIALSLVVVFGTELFTGNNMIGVTGMLNKAITFKDMIFMWIAAYIGAYIGNIVGSVVLAIIYVFSNSASKSVVDFIVKVSKVKVAALPQELFFKGILCNILVCLAVLAGIKLKEETARLIMVFWCLFAFITAGFEHSVANMTLLMMGIMYKGITLNGYFYNLLFVTLGNIVGGGFIGYVCYYLGKKEIKK
ncbi:formate/nitrite transporter family protein [Leptotrichia wadei]|uniref:formate/nitrite transporter family protein n=1 Tax=Leptotrichia wadei TaxID=157687 RepID=UPI0011BDF75F|nr:formate/nitrite transporter family protein [Leptotrichia wadei]